MFKSASKQGLPAVCVGAHALFRSSAVPSPPFLKAFDFGGQAGVCFVSLSLTVACEVVVISRWLLSHSAYLSGKKTCGWSCVVVVDSQMDP